MQEANEFQNTLFTHDNLFVLHGMNSEIADLIYIDPPFNSKRMYSAPVGTKAAGTSFKDMWSWEDVNEAYLETLATKYPSLVKFIQAIEGLHSKGMMAYILYMALNCSNILNLLDARGALSQIERKSYILRVRNLVKGVCERVV